MNFHFDVASQDKLSGWLTPDNPSVRSRFVIRGPEIGIIEFDANANRPDIKDLGWHTTGDVGFSIDDTVVPGFAELSDFDFCDFHTGFTLYSRHANPGLISGRLMFFDCSCMPQWRLHKQIGQNFAIQYPSLDRHSLETSLALLWNAQLDSGFVSGYPNLHRYMVPLDVRAFHCVALLRDPIEELAERLLFLKTLSKLPEDSGIRSLFTGYKTLISICSDVDLTERRAVLRLLRGSDGHVRELLKSPITKTFGTEATEPVDRKKVPVALENLSKMALVGFREDYDRFAYAFDGLMERRILAGTKPSEIPGVAELSLLLRDIGPATDLVEEDLALYEFAKEALREIEGENA